MLGGFKIKVSDERAAAIIEEISLGSEPRLRFYLMVAASTMLASFGLIMDSTAVIIGAMLVAPLMTPIFGIALALVRGDAHLLGRAMQAEAAGVLLAILLAICLGYTVPEISATEEMLARTKPSLLDLLVAIFAGFAGAYAIVDENISPALPGVAIATAIVPPLANCGLSIALGYNHWAIGSFLLFFANFLSILLVTSLVFIAVQAGSGKKPLSSLELVRRFSLATIGFCVLVVFLSRSLSDIIEEQRVENTIREVLVTELTHLPASDLEKLIFRERDGKLYCLVHLHASEFITPSRVKAAELKLEQALDRPVELFFRSTLSKDVSSSGAFNQINAQNLGGFYIDGDSDHSIKLVRAADQVLREFIDQFPIYKLTHVNLFELGGVTAILASIQGPREFTTEQIQQVESTIRTISGMDTVQLMIRHINIDFYDKSGQFFYEWISAEDPKPHQVEIDQFIDTLKSVVAESDFFLENTTYSIRKGALHLLVQLTGPRLLNQVEFDQLQAQLEQSISLPLKLYVRTRPETVLTTDGHTSFKALQQQRLEEAETLYSDELKHMRDHAL